jgi:hypothetical protein
MLCTPRGTPVSQTLVERELGAMPMLADAVKCAITSQRTGLSGAARPVQMHKPKSTETCIGRQPAERFQPIHDCPSVTIGCNP